MTSVEWVAHLSRTLGQAIEAIDDGDRAAAKQGIRAVQAALERLGLEFARRDLAQREARKVPMETAEKILETVAAGVASGPEKVP